MHILKSALFWRILLSSLLVVAVLGVGLSRANNAHEELEKQFERLVQHDLKLADDAEQLLRLMVDLETGKRGYLLTGDRSFLAPYEQARRDLEGLLTEAQDVAESGIEDERVAAFGRLLHDWIENVSEPQIRARQKGTVPDPAVADEGKSRTDEMRGILSDLRRHALDDADERQQAAFESAGASQRATRTVLLLAIIIALGSGAWIARDIAGTTGQLEEALAATGRLEPLPTLPARRDELGAVARSLAKMNALLLEKDSSLRATLAERERTLAELRRANEALAQRDARARAYAEFVRELRALDVGALVTGGLQTLVRLADAQVGAVYLLDDANRLVPVQATSTDGRAIEHEAFGAEGLPRSVMERREAVFLRADELGAPLPALDLGIGTAPLRWVLAYPVALGTEGAGAIVLSGIQTPSEDVAESVRDATRQLGVALHNAWTHGRLREKSVALAEQGERLTRANKVKTEFLASMSHELRTPLSAILGFADLLLTSPKEQLSPRARESLERIKRNGEHLLALINDVLDLAKAEAGRVEVRLGPVNIGQLARACVAEVDSLRGGKNMRLAVDVGDAPVETVTDAQRVRQIIINLLANAIKFTDEGEVVLAVRAAGNEVHVSVRDTGIGIPAHAMKELFQDFHQLEAGDGRRYDGTGVGLALSRRLAHALGGEIEVRSRQGEGSVFTLVLPRLFPPALVGAPVLSSPPMQPAPEAALLTPPPPRPGKTLS
ncbi:MAG TPA: ATP-binding protein [Polyangiaceae bacterium]|nr:ATP-binding protein [Polyangiaceae bacterium]